MRKTFGTNPNPGQVGLLDLAIRMIRVFRLKEKSAGEFLWHGSLYPQIGPKMVLLRTRPAQTHLISFQSSISYHDYLHEKS